MTPEDFKRLRRASVVTELTQMRTEIEHEASKDVLLHRLHCLVVALYSCTGTPLEYSDLGPRETLERIGLRRVDRG
jgi:hypothetical protein